MVRKAKIQETKIKAVQHRSQLIKRKTKPEKTGVVHDGGNSEDRVATGTLDGGRAF